MMAHAYVLYLAREYDRAIAQILRTLESHPDFWPGRGVARHGLQPEGAARRGHCQCTRAAEISEGVP